MLTTVATFVSRACASQSFLTHLYKGSVTLQLTTGQAPRTAAMILRGDGLDLRELDDGASVALDTAVRQLAKGLQDHWDLVNLARRHMQKKNRDRASSRAIPDIAVGDHVLYAVHKPETKLDYTWRGPGLVTDMPNLLICTIVPCTAHPSKPFSAAPHDGTASPGHQPGPPR